MLPAKFNALVVAAGRVLINFKAKLKAAVPILGHVFAVEKIKCVSLVQIGKGNHLRNVRGLVRQLLKLLRLHPAPFQYHTFRVETTVQTHQTQRLPTGTGPNTSFSRDKRRGKAPAMELMLDADETDPEDYNIRSAECTKLLIQLKDLFDSVPVSPALWACCQLCNKRELSTLVNVAKIDSNFLLVYEMSLPLVSLLCKLLLLMLYFDLDYRYAHG